MLTFDNARTTCQNLSGDATTTSLTFFDLMMNQGYKYILAELGRAVTERTKTASYVEDQQYYQCPPEFLWLKAITVTIGSTKYPVTEIVNQDEWDILNMTAQYGDIPTFCFVRPNWGVGGLEIGIYPIPSTTANVTFTITAGDATVGATYTNNSQTFTVVSTIDGATTLNCTFTGYPEASGTLTKSTGTGDATLTFSAVTYSGIVNLVYESGDKDMARAAYTTGTVTMTNGDDDVVGDSTVWITAMVGRYFQVTSEAGDGLWYKVASRSSNTAIKLENYYEGASGATLDYTICEAFSLPEEMQILPVYYALQHYYSMKQDSKKQADFYALFDIGIKSGKRRYGTKSRGAIIKRNPWLSGRNGYPGHFPGSITS